MKPVLSSLLAVLLTSVVAAPQAADGHERSINQRQHVQRNLDRQSRDIHRERNDGQRRTVHAGPRPDHGWRGNHYGWQGSTRAFDRRIDHVQHDQRRRIEQGLRSGALTRHEASRLMAEQRAIEAEERRYLADGVVTRAERVDLLQHLNAAARHIYNESHDAQTRR